VFLNVLYISDVSERKTFL